MYIQIEFKDKLVWVKLIISTLNLKLFNIKYLFDFRNHINIMILWAFGISNHHPLNHKVVIGIQFIQKGFLSGAVSGIYLSPLNSQYGIKKRKYKKNQTCE